ncbi:unnamed protein product, partial [Hapterophycus canaliculatus]
MAVACNNSAQKDDEDMREFLEMLEIHFIGRRCYLGQYGLAKLMPSADGNGNSSGSSSGVGSMIITLDPPNKFVLGAFLTGELDQTWEYWEGEVGPSGLAAHRESLGWDGHSLETLMGCFVGAIAEEKVSPPQPSTAATGGAPGAAADEHQQRPPEFSNTEEAERYLGEKGGASFPSAERSDAAAAAAAAVGAAPTGTLDLHYSGAGIVGSWEVRRLQSGISAALMNSMHRSIRAACGRASTDSVEASASASRGTGAPSSRRKPSGSFKAKRKR